MDAKVKAFLEQARAEERKAFETQRDAHLMSLGLYTEEKSFRGNRLRRPIEVSDKEYEEILKVAPLEEEEVVEEVNLKNGAEKFLGIINKIFLALGILHVVVIFVAAISYWDEMSRILGRDVANGVLWFLIFLCLELLLIYFVTWAGLKVTLNISNNLHEINSKLPF